MLPLSFCRKAVSRPAKKVVWKGSSRVELRNRWVAHLLGWNPFLLTQPTTVLYAIEPIDHDHRTVVSRAILGVIFNVGAIALKLLDRNLAIEEIVTTWNLDSMLKFDCRIALAIVCRR